MTHVRQPEAVSPTAPVSDRASDPAATEELRRCVRGLLGTTADPETPFRLSEELSAARFRVMVSRHRLVPFLHTHASRLDLPTDLTYWLQMSGGSSRLRCLLLARELFRSLDVLEAAGLPVLVVKGLALAGAAHHDLAARGVGDLDLLIRPQDAARAHRALTDAGWHAPPGYPDPSQQRVWAYAVRNGYEHAFVGSASIVDLHWRLDPTLGGLPNFDTLWTCRTSVQVDGRRVLTLSPWHALLHSCSHAAKDDWKWLRSLVDLIVLASDAEIWSGPPRRLTRVQLASLGIAFDLLGTPGQVPAATGVAAAAAARGHLRSVRRRQSEVKLPLRARFPGAGSLHAIRRRSRGSWAPSDLRRVVFSAVVPTSLLGELADQSPPAAAATLLRLRLRSARLWFEPMMSSSA
ncbi:MAG TPA: nucleotidyltransferase family protein [Propionibacteriaceae bacterium]|nr:nucleotidyltransferase family protein [Propionibacteriaceae bacterium]